MPLEPEAGRALQRPPQGGRRDRRAHPRIGLSGAVELHQPPVQVCDERGTLDSRCPRPPPTTAITSRTICSTRISAFTRRRSACCGPSMRN